MALAMIVDAAALLQDLAAVPAELRLARLSEAGEPEATLVALCEESDRMAASELAGALATSELLLTMAHDLGSPCAQDLRQLWSRKRRVSRTHSYGIGSVLRLQIRRCKPSVALIPEGVVAPEFPDVPDSIASAAREAHAAGSIGASMAAILHHIKRLTLII